MTRMSVFSAPFLLGFDVFEERIDRLNKASDSYPPYNIERMTDKDGTERFVITVAVAGFAEADLDLVLEDSQLVIKGQRAEEASKDFLHQGIAARQFQRAFLLADGMQVGAARLEAGLLVIEVKRPPAERRTRRISIDVKE